eukprot:m.28774 g.28774  ORF g.28774 m.28774 type:complete len:66 (-) comp10476_c0_seq1:2260-2457(-)
MFMLTASWTRVQRVTECLLEVRQITQPAEPSRNGIHANEKATKKDRRDDKDGSDSAGLLRISRDG